MIKISITGKLLTRILTKGYKIPGEVTIAEGLPEKCELHSTEVITNITRTGEIKKVLELFFANGKEEIEEVIIQVEGQ